MLWDGIARRAFGVGGGGGDPVLHTPIERGPRRKLRIGLALGGGAARGWAHIGIMRVMGLLDFHISGSGLIAGDRLKRLLDRDLSNMRIESLPLRFATVATELGT